MGTKTLIVYYSWSGNTKQIANKINKTIKSDIFEVNPQIPYPSDYSATIKQAKKEISDKFLPEMKTKFTNKLSEYDTVFIGSPNWWGTIAPVIVTFLKENDLSNKTIIPFITHGSGGEQNTIRDLKNILPNAIFKDALILNGALTNTQESENKITSWLAKISY